VDLALLKCFERLRDMAIQWNFQKIVKTRKSIAIAEFVVS